MPYRCLRTTLTCNSTNNTERFYSVNAANLITGIFMNKKKIVGILSTNFSGSHFLSLLLGSHSKIAHIGELKKLKRHDAHRESKGPVCYICDDSALCPVQANISPENISQAYRTIFNNFNDPKLETLIDTSKKISWFNNFINNDEFEWTFIHLIRDPRAAIRRWDIEFNNQRDRNRQKVKLIKKNPSQTLRYLKANRYFIYLYKWLEQNKTITNFLTENNLPNTLVTYKQLATQTETEIERLTAWLDYSYEPEQIEYWRFQHHGSQKPQYKWIKDEKVNSHFDLRWQQELPEQIIHDTANDPLVMQYLQSINVEMKENGLVVKPDLLF